MGSDENYNWFEGDDFEDEESMNDAIKFEHMFKQFSPERMDNLLSENDRGYVLAIQVIFEKMLGAMLLAHFKRVGYSEEKRMNAILGRNLQDFFIRHELCEALGLIGRETRDTLNAVRQLRIKAGHGEIFKLTRADVDGIRGACPSLLKKMKGQESMATLLGNEPEYETLSKERFDLTDILQALHALLFHNMINLQLGEDYVVV